MGPPPLTAAGLVWRPGRGRAGGNGVDGVSLELIPSEIVALAGPHGAGKTALLELLGGRRRPHAGWVLVAGRAAHSAAARRFLGFAPEHAVFPPGLTVREVLEYFARYHAPGVARRALVARALELAGLDAAPAMRTGALAAGFRARLAVAQATLGNRRVVLVDEPFTGLDDPGRRALGETLRRLAGSGVAVVVASRDATPLERVATRAVVLNRGRVVHDGAMATLLGRRVLEVLLDRSPAVAPPGFRVTGTGVEAELGETSVEAALALCRAHRLAVRASRVRERPLDEVIARLPGAR